MDIGTFHYYTSWHEYANERAYSAPAEPWEPIRVSPADILAVHERTAIELGTRARAGRRLGRGGVPPANSRNADVPGTGAALRRGAGLGGHRPRRASAGAVRGRESFRGYESLAEFRNVRCSYLDDRYESIASEGYRANREAAHEPASGENPFEDAYAHQLEPLVVVGREGAIYWSEGFHRFAIADILGLDRIPVQVLCRHEQWQAVRDTVGEKSGGEKSGGEKSGGEKSGGEKSGGVDVPRDHPDRQDVGR